MVTITDVQGPKMSKGVVLALLSAFFYASYLVLVKHKSDTEEKIDIPLFFGKHFGCFFLNAAPFSEFFFSSNFENISEFYEFYGRMFIEETKNSGRCTASVFL